MVLVVFNDKHVMFKVECPYGLIKNSDLKKKITERILYEILINKIPLSISKADFFSKISIRERNEIINMFKFLNITTMYNDIRWGNINGRN